MLKRRLPPLWFLALLVAGQLAWNHYIGPPQLAAPGVHVAFWALLFTIGTLIWDGLQAAGQAALAVLAVSVNTLWLVVRTVYDGLTIAARGILDGFRASWDFLRGLYDDVLKPGWLKFWKFIDWAKSSLERVMRPVFRVLFRLRSELLKFYDRFVRPVLDLIGIMRQALRVFSALGLEWAKKLDAKLGQLEEKIDAPFRLLLRELNNVINVVNRVVTANGLFQRLALVKSIVRDFSVIGDEFARWHKPPLSAEEIARRRAAKYQGDDPATPGVELGKLYRGQSGAYTAIVGELVPTWRLAAGLRATRASQ